MTPEIAAKLAACGIQMAAEARDYCMFVRENCLALVRVEGEQYVSIGSSGVLTEKGVAYLVWEDGAAILSAHGTRVPADPTQVQAIEEFSRDLKRVLL